MWATADIRPTVPGYDVLPPGISSDALLPLGYVFTSNGTALAPMYAPGLPMQMALFERLGGRDAVFWVMPLLTGLAAWATYALGSRAGGPHIGVLAAALFATSPAVLFQLTHAPMSDLPAAAWWTVALVALLYPSRWAALECGVATGLAILTRPNLVPLALLPGALLLWHAVRSSDERARAWQRLALFAAGSIPACAAVAVLNAYWYGSPLLSGYGALSGTYYQWAHFWPNVRLYAGWMLQTQAPVALLAALAPILFVRSPGKGIAISALFVVMVWVSYVFYLSFEQWWTLRFLLPAFPALCVLASAALFRAAEWLPARSRGLAISAVLAVAIGWNLGFTHMTSAIETDVEWRYATIGRLLDQQSPRRSVVLAFLHSGSARYYADRLTLRWDRIEPSQFDSAIATIRQRGYAAYLLIDDAEEAQFKARFAGASRLAALDWTPQATVAGASLYAVPQGRP
jgi:hypothetical protein